MVSPNHIKKIPIAIGIKPSQPTTFTNKTIDCGPGNGNVISNLPNTSLENNSLTINGVEIALGGTGIIDATLQTRKTASENTNVSIAPGDVRNLTISNVGKTYALLKIQTSAAAWVTIYTDTVSRTADASRPETQEPSPGSGVLAEIITSGPTTQILTPGIFGFNNDPTISSNVYVKLVSKESSGTTLHTVTLHYLQLEA